MAVKEVKTAGTKRSIHDRATQRVSIVESPKNNGLPLGLGWLRKNKGIKYVQANLSIVSHKILIPIEGKIMLKKELTNILMEHL